MSIHSTNIIGQDCTNGGVTSGKDRIKCLEVFDGVVPEGFHGDVILALLIETSCIRGHGRPNVLKDGSVAKCRCVPAFWDGASQSYELRRTGMFGGNFVTTSDGRFPAQNPVPVHDRFE